MLKIKKTKFTQRYLYYYKILHKLLKANKKQKTEQKFNFKIKQLIII